MITEKSIVRAVSKLNFLTKSGQLKWASKHLPYDWYVDSGVEKTLNPAYDTSHEGRNLRLFKYTARHYTDEDVYTISAHVVLCIIDEGGNLSWEFPMDRSVYDLYETVRYKIADVEGFLGKLTEGLPEDPEPDDYERNDLPF